MAFTKEQMAENIKRFEELLGSVHRDGIDRLLDFIRKSDFTRLRHPPDFTVPVREDFCTTRSRYTTVCREKIRGTGAVG